MVPGAGIEPARYFYRGILSPLRLPISPPGQLGGFYLTFSYFNLSSRLTTTVYHNATRAIGA